jgi:hypothetical protein
LVSVNGVFFTTCLRLQTKKECRAKARAGQPGAAATVRAGLQLGQFSAAGGAAPSGATLDVDYVGLGKRTCKSMKQDENEQNHKKKLMLVVGQKPYGKSQFKWKT